MPLQRLNNVFSFHRSISAKLSVACVMVAFVSSAASLKVFFDLEDTQGGLQEITSLYRPLQNSARSIARQANLNHQRLFLFTTWSSVGLPADKITKLGSEITESLTDIRRLLDETRHKQGLDGAEVETLEKTSKQWDDYSKSALDILDIGIGDPALATVMLGGVEDQYRSIYKNILRVNNAISEKGDKSALSVSKWAKNASTALVFGQLALIALLVVLYILLYRYVFGPIGRVTTVMSELAQGYSNRLLPATNRADEVGEMIRSIENFRQKLESDSSSIIHLAEHDSLTGLSNRTKLDQEIAELVSGTSAGNIAAVLLIDLDGFKMINDTQGHFAGDQLLIEVAKRLKSRMCQTGSIFRLGGDEFAILIGGLKNCDDAATLATDLCRIIEEPYDIEGITTKLSASIGTALVPNDGTTKAVLLKKADMALYEAKAQGRNTFCFFRKDMEQCLIERRSFEEDLRKAVKLRQFELAFQPLVEAKTRKVTSFEALLRWRHPVRGIVSPAEFIPVAEEIGVMGDLGGWVIEQACRSASRWPEAIGVAVNVSPLQFKSGGLDQVILDALEQSGLPARRLELEITESVFLNKSENVIATLKNLRRKGVRIAIDDFGTGYSSLSYLRNLPFDKIKVDQSFVRDEGKSSISIVKAIAGLGVSLGVSVTAEGIETTEQFSRMVAIGCTEMQGYLFSRPISDSEISKFLTTSEDAQAA